ncbi:MAG: hypothetical protein P8M49_08890, partial [Thalassotalea sp.]|nr:hypothetical protein [Thalassotalea sp.]
MEVPHLASAREGMTMYWFNISLLDNRIKTIHGAIVETGIYSFTLTHKQRPRFQVDLTLLI